MKVKVMGLNPGYLLNLFYFKTSQSHVFTNFESMYEPRKEFYIFFFLFEVEVISEIKIDN